jgi:hypothetical protein
VRRRVLKPSLRRHPAMALRQRDNYATQDEQEDEHSSSHGGLRAMYHARRADAPFLTNLQAVSAAGPGSWLTIGASKTVLLLLRRMIRSTKFLRAHSGARRLAALVSSRSDGNVVKTRLAHPAGTSAKEGNGFIYLWAGERNGLSIVRVWHRCGVQNSPAGVCNFTRRYQWPWRWRLWCY